MRLQSGKPQLRVELGLFDWALLFKEHRGVSGLTWGLRPDGMGLVGHGVRSRGLPLSVGSAPETVAVGLH